VGFSSNDEISTYDKNIGILKIAFDSATFIGYSKVFFLYIGLHTVQNSRQPASAKSAIYSGPLPDGRWVV
jgi:hypothetical protein